MQRRALWTGAIALVLACSNPPTDFELVPQKDNAKADGKEGIVVVAQVSKGGSPVSRGTVTFSLDTEGAAFATISDPSKPPPLQDKQVNVTNGTAKVTVYSVTPATVGIVAAFNDPVSRTNASATANVKFTGSSVPVSSFEYLGADPTPVPLGGSSTIKFKALNSSGVPVAKVPVVFSISSQVASIDPTSAETLTDGTVTTTLTAGTVASNVTVTIAAANDSTINRTSEAIAISGGGINAKNLSLVCPHYSIGGFQKFGLEMECTAYASDYTGAYVPKSQVTFMTEAGGVPTTVPLSADPARGGFAKIPYRTQCQLPRDVPPLGEAAGDPGNPCMILNPCGTASVPEARTCNPRDGWATLVAISTGGESFQDGNGNLQWDPGEKFIDLPEPFVDANDNGTRDNDPANDNVEDFYDYDNDQEWDDKNGVWDAYTAVWTSVKIMWTDEPHELILTPGNDPGPGAGGASPHCTTIQYVGFLKDVYGNPPTAAGTGDKVQATCTGNCKLVRTETYHDSDSDRAGLVDVTITDTHSCTGACTPPSCAPTRFTLDLGIIRSLDPKGTAKVTENLNPVIGVDPGPRVGTFE